MLNKTFENPRNCLWGFISLLLLCAIGDYGQVVLAVLGPGCWAVPE